MPSTTVRLAGHEYSLVVEPGATGAVPQLAGRLIPGRCVLITDKTVAGLHLNRVQGVLESAGISVTVATMPAGEKHKTLETLSGLFDQVLPKKPDRKTPVVALGGGVVGDVAGFLAATLLRGVPFIQVPTTLLAMVDASVGGKTGIDHPAGKNMIGAFHQPSLVVADPLVLGTLSREVFQDGLAECVKHFVIRDEAGLKWMESHLDAILDRETTEMTELVFRNVSIKARVVEDDPKEQGARAHLNLGHTFGHAVETLSNYEISHGQAVAMGTVVACRLAVMSGGMSAAQRDRVKSLLERIGLPTRLPAMDTAQVLAAMMHDKKVLDGKLRLVLPVGLGAATVRDDLPVELVARAIAESK